MKKIKCIAVLLALSLLLCSCAKDAPSAKPDSAQWNTNYTFVFVHGLSGWGSYDGTNKVLKYWGMFGGDLMAYLEEQGFTCRSASVAPHGSAWDRACELYAQLTGSVVDYGKEHSERCHHDRYGEDYSDKPLVDAWSSEDKINLLGHSFGGATVRLLSELMANGSADEQNATESDDLSPLFAGGKGDWIYSVTALAAPHNGTTAYDVDTEEAPEEKTLKTRLQDKMTGMLSSVNQAEDDGRIATDNANFDMLLDNAKAMNDKIHTFENIYYFSVPCASTIAREDGTHIPDENKTETLFLKTSALMGKYTETSPGGIVVDDTWFENDGLVNTVSATAPFGAPQKAYDEGDIPKGVWNVFPTYDGDHMSLQGGLFKKNDVREFYTELLNTINTLTL